MTEMGTFSISAAEIENVPISCLENGATACY